MSDVGPNGPRASPSSRAEPATSSFACMTVPGGPSWLSATAAPNAFCANSTKRAASRTMRYGVTARRPSGPWTGRGDRVDGTGRCAPAAGHRRVDPASDGWNAGNVQERRSARAADRPRDRAVRVESRLDPSGGGHDVNRLQTVLLVSAGNSVWIAGQSRRVSRKTILPSRSRRRHGHRLLAEPAGAVVQEVMPRGCVGRFRHGWPSVPKTKIADRRLTPGRPPGQRSAAATSRTLLEPSHADRLSAWLGSRRVRRDVAAALR